jgi:hypothetical protein
VRLVSRRRSSTRLAVLASSLLVVSTLGWQSQSVGVEPAAADGPVDTPAGTGETVTDLLEQVADGDILTNTSAKEGNDGRQYWVKNHLRPDLLSADVLDLLKGVPGLREDVLDLPLLGGDAGGEAPDDGLRRKYLVAWAGDNNILDKSGAELLDLPKTIGPDLIGQKDLIGPDFFAVIDATPGSDTYGKVVNTATVGPLVENEPHHMQYTWQKGQNIFAGGLFTDVTYVLDTSKLPALSLKGVNLPTDTLCGTVPDAYWVTEDNKAYGTYMGGPDVPGPCTYSDGTTRFGNGFAGSPGEVVRLGENGETIYEAPATPEEGETKLRCDNIPALPRPTCANPHGIQAREDLDILITSDYNEPRNIILNPVQAPSSYLRRPTVRTYDISDQDAPALKNVSFLPDGPRTGKVAHHEENRAAMEVTVTNQPENKGAFVSTMQGGAIFYAPDITAQEPEWRQVFDITTSNKMADPAGNYYGGGSNGAWVQTSYDDRYLYHAVQGRQGTDGSKPYILVLDIQELLASGDAPECEIDTLAEVTEGGQESDCPAVVDVLDAPGGPHWGALDNLELGDDGLYRDDAVAQRLAYSNYFVARTGLNGDHRVCIADQAEDGTLSLDEEFRDEYTGQTCLDFDRAAWPHGEWGPAKPHSMLFVAADEDVR